MRSCRNFYRTAIKKNEFLFLNKLKNNVKPDFNLDIERVDVVIDEIKDYQWTSSSILNNHILTYIILNGHSEQLGAFVQAIRKYYNDYNENDFIELYINTIAERNCLHKIKTAIFDEIEKILLSDSPKTIKLNLLVAFFCEKSGPLFCEMLDYYSVDQLEEYGVIIKEFLMGQKNVLNYTLDSAIHSDSLKERLNRIDFECENLSDYKDKPDIQRLLIDGDMFQVSKENLDFVLKQINGSQNIYGYEYFKQRNNIWKKIKHPNEINSFVEQIILAGDRLNYSQYGIVEILFDEKVKTENVAKIIEKIQDESIELSALTGTFVFSNGKFPESYSNIVKDLLELNKLDLNFNNILYVYKLYSKGLIQFAQKVFRKLDSLIKSHSLNFEKNDQYAMDNYLHDFFDTILVTPQIDNELFEKIADIMIYQHINIIELTKHSLDFFGDISATKIQILIKLIFKNLIFKNDSVNDFLEIINQGFGNIYQNFDKIKDKCNNDWNCKQAWILFLSILLKNINNIQEYDKIVSLIELISLNDFGDIIKEWSVKGKKDTSNNVKKLLTPKILDIWVKKFGRSVVLDFFDNYKESLDEHIIIDIKEYIEQIFISSVDQEPAEKDKSYVKNLLEIAEKYRIPPRAIFERKIKLKKMFEPLITILCDNSDIDFGWTQIMLITHDIVNSKSFLQKSLKIIKKDSNPSNAKKAALLLLPKNSFRAVFRNDLFILGRFFYNAIEKKQLHVDDFISFEKNDLLKISTLWSLHPLLSGAIFEGFFDKDNNLKNDTAKDYLDRLIHELSKDPNTEGYEFIRDCLKPFYFKLNSYIVSTFNL